MRWWERSVGGPARGRIIALLRRRQQSVEELAAELGVTDNAVRAQLQALERDGIVRQAGIRHTGVVGKPPTTFEIAPAAEKLLSTAYAPMLRTLVTALEHRMPKSDLEDLFREVGRRLAAENGVTAAGAPASPQEMETRVRAAADFLAALGGELEIERANDGYTLRGFACPLSDAVCAQPNVCHAVEELVSQMVGAPVHECCERNGKAKCRFEVKAAASR